MPIASDRQRTVGPLLDHPALVTFLAGVEVRDEQLLDLARQVRRAGFEITAAKLERAWAGEDQTLALETDDREALLRVLDHNPGLAVLQSVLLQEHERKLGGGH
jgi:hypothetical protein